MVVCRIRVYGTSSSRFDAMVGKSHKFPPFGFVSCRDFSHAVGVRVGVRARGLKVEHVSTIFARIGARSRAIRICSHAYMHFSLGGGYVRIFVVQERPNKIFGFCTIRKGGFALLRNRQAAQAASTPVLRHLFLLYPNLCSAPATACSTAAAPAGFPTGYECTW